MLDDCVYHPYSAGASFTGEDMLEIFTHGNPLIVRLMIDDLLKRGCRAAEPGEFTRRAFLNGRMDLTQAEAVQDLISARSEQALAAAQRQLNGSVGRAVNALLEKLLRVIAWTEAYIDFPEEDLPPESSTGPISELVAIQDYAKRMMATAPYSAMLREGARTVIAGEPNAGKSSLLNALLGEERAIVSTEPGTTRDYIEERLVVGTYLLRVVDTAGLRGDAAGIEGIGIVKSREQIARADLVLFVVDSTLPPSPPPFDLAALRQGAGLIVVENKCDLPGSVSMADVLPDAVHVRVSALSGTGLDELRDAVTAALAQCWHNPGQDDVLVSARHAAALKEMCANLASAADKLRTRAPLELAANDLRCALDALGQIVGRVDNERVLDLVFSTFCIGK
jgi:tRNA modification GTPase